ncbi:OpgC family protein [Aestuariibius sp. 2305UL40-4]|uniref:OpgC family protein n=1 Tax=Aestuariibius violaceus TaxID=3234132 RepID=UPI00345E2CF6
MTLADTATLNRETPAPIAAAPVARIRDPRLDFFRGIAMFIILFAHTPGNWVTLWIPARFGFSDATEIFVFCSGMASAIAFGGTFDRAGWTLGTARVGFRIWQVYWAHIGLFVATVGLTIFLTNLDVTGRNYWGQLNLWPLFVDSENWSNTENMLALMTLRYVPNYFDILPMYMVVLAMMPLVMALSRVSLWAAAAPILLFWLFAQEALTAQLDLPHFAFPAEPWSERNWFFNPFGWALIFFTGFALMRGWIPKPPVTPLLLTIAALIVLANVPLSNIGIRSANFEWLPLWWREFGVDWARDWRIANRPWFDKSDFGILRYVHFLALAYLAWALAGEAGRRLLPPEGDGPISRIWTPCLAAIMKVGQQSLAVFITSMFLARLLGFSLDVLGRSYGTMALVNITGCLILIAVAYGAGWFKTQPWRARK